MSELIVEEKKPAQGSKKTPKRVSKLANADFVTVAAREEEVGADDGQGGSEGDIAGGDARHDEATTSHP